MTPRTAITRTVSVLKVTRARSSVNGNPAFTFHTDDGDYRTQSDTSCAWSVENHWSVGSGRWRDLERGIEWTDEPARVELTMTPARRVYGFRIL